jgi:hypothetical protein
VIDFSGETWYTLRSGRAGEPRCKMVFIFLGKNIFIKMDNYDTAMEYIETQEATDIAYIKVGSGNKKLIVSFASNSHEGFERKTSLMKLKYEHNDFDVLYLRNRLRWYIGGLKGIGKNINCTITFLKTEFAKYDKVCCTGGSAGGYASLLFGSLLNVNCVITINAQTDLQYVKNEMNHSQLIKRAKECPATWSKYNKISNVLNNNVSYNVYYTGDDFFQKQAELKGNVRSLVLHGDYHYDEIKHFPNVSKFNSEGDFVPLIEKFLEETS